MKDTYQKIAEAKVSITTTLEICKDFRCNLVSNVVLDNLVAVINAAEVKVKETFTLCTGKQLDSHKPISFI